MSGVAGRSGRKSKRQEIEYYFLERYSLAYLLHLMRNKQTDEKLEDRKFRTALEICGKRLSRPVVIDASKHLHVDLGEQKEIHKLEFKELVNRSRSILQESKTESN